mmetsp:Transcript_17517/g.30304  ORF Transcript_17517/g.30304 Transcript_17517/m.30304 type:complete len:242 (-) Transcript_17517:96-821(-)
MMKSTSAFGGITHLVTPPATLLGISRGAAIVHPAPTFPYARSGVTRICRVPPTFIRGIFLPPSRAISHASMTSPLPTWKLTDWPTSNLSPVCTTVPSKLHVTRSPFCGSAPSPTSRSLYRSSSGPSRYKWMGISAPEGFRPNSIPKKPAASPSAVRRVVGPETASVGSSVAFAESISLAMSSCTAIAKGRGRTCAAVWGTKRADGTMDAGVMMAHRRPVTPKLTRKPMKNGRRDNKVGGGA